MNDEDIIRGCRNDNRTAQNLLFTNYERRVLGVCLRYASNPDEAKDIQQETFIKIFRNLKSVATKIDSLEKWIIRIAVNTAIDYFRKERSLKSISDHASLQITAPTVLDKLSEEELIALIHTIPNPYRAVFNLFIVDGYSHKEIGDMMGITESTSRSYLTRAKDFIKEVIERREKKIISYG